MNILLIGILVIIWDMTRLQNVHIKFIVKQFEVSISSLYVDENILLFYSLNFIYIHI